MFEPNRGRLIDMMPLAMAMCLNVILPNLSLAFSTVAFYQIVRTLLTPMVAAINFFCYGTAIPRQGLIALIPVCVGVGIVTYYDTHVGKAGSVATTSPAGVFFAFAGVLASSLYTVWLSVFQKRFSMNSFQLLLNQAPTSAFLLLYVIPFTDRWPLWEDVAAYRYWLIALVRLLSLFAEILLTQTTERGFCGLDQYITILHCCWSRSCQQHCCWSPQNLFDCHFGVDRDWSWCIGQMCVGHRYRYGRYHSVSSSLVFFILVADNSRYSIIMYRCKQKSGLKA